MPTIRDNIADSQAVTRFRGTPVQFLEIIPSALARRVTYRVIPRGLDTTYKYKLHRDRCLAYRWLNRADNAERLLVPD